MTCHRRARRELRSVLLNSRSAQTLQLIRQRVALPLQLVLVIQQPEVVTAYISG